MFISVLELFKTGIGPSSSHTMGPMIAAKDFIDRIPQSNSKISIRCILKGSLAFTGKGHNTDRAVALGLYGYSPESLIDQNIDILVEHIWQNNFLDDNKTIAFSPSENIIFDFGEPLPEHPNAMILEMLDQSEKVFMSETYFSIGGGFITTLAEISQVVAPLKMEPDISCPFSFESASSMLQMSIDSGLSIGEMKRINELEYLSEKKLNDGLDKIWQNMQTCVEKGLIAEGILPGGLDVSRRAKTLHDQLNSENANLNDWLCAYAMAVNEENAAGHMVVTAPTNGAAGVIPAVLYYLMIHEAGTVEQLRYFLLTASAIGGLIKYRSSISGAEVGCQGEVGSAASMAAAGLCAVRGGSVLQVENACSRNCS